MKNKIILILIILVPIFLIALVVYLPRHIAARENKNYSVANDADISAQNQSDTIKGPAIKISPETSDPAVHKDDTDLGDINRIIYITTNDPNQPRLEAEITAQVIKSNQ